MLKNLLNYKIIEKIDESMHATIYKAQLKNDPNHKVVIKKIKRQFITAGLSDYLKQQIDYFSGLHLQSGIQPILINPTHELIFLVQPWVPGLSLSDFLRVHTEFDLKNSLTLIISLLKQIEERHKAGFIHKSIKPSNIIVQLDDNSVQLIDDIRILDINQISHFVYQENFKHNTLPYISPEQTGRIKQEVNYSTDLYSLGIVFFQCLTRKVPFYDNDPIAIIHSHLAETPCSATAINPDTPAIISKIIEILLQKAPEKRYQTATGVIYDLEQCLQQLQQDHKVADFPLKQKDYSNRITIPSLLVGRDSQKQQLLAEHALTCSGAFRAAFISGLSGIGKTRLIQELQLPIVTHASYFTAGKFDQFKKHIPYSTLIQAWKNLVKLFLTEDEQRLIYWQQRISSALGEHGQLMIDLVPNLELIIGSQPPIKELPPIESRNRFNLIASKFLACLSSAEHPLTLFIDDLQWCDGATFDLIERIFNTPEEYPYLYLIGAYRHNEVDKSHRLSYLIEKIKSIPFPLLEIRLNSLTIHDVNQMTAYILNTYPTRTEALSELIYQTSTGNPLFVNESLRWLHSYKHLRLNYKGIWTWDDSQLRHTAIPSTALDLFKDKINKLSSETRQLLAIAACLGANFYAADLALVACVTLDELYLMLHESFSQNILLRDKDCLLFFHDQVQAAAESFIDEQEKKQVHQTIAQALIKAVGAKADLTHLDNIFSIVEHLLAGRMENASDADKKQEAEYNYAAGIVAMNALAMDNANFFFQQSKLLFPCPDWTQHYSFLFNLYKHLARTEMAIGNQLASEALLDTLIENSRNDLDRIDCLYEQTTGLSSMGNFKEAIKLGNIGLQFFHRDIPDNDQLALQKAQTIIEKIHGTQEDIWQKILTLTPSNERATKIETGIYSELIPDYYLAGMVPQLYLSAIQSTENCLAGGVDETVIYGFSMVGLYLQQQGQYSMSFRYEDLGLALAERYPDTFGATKGINGILWTNMHNRHDSAHIIDQCEKNIHRGKVCGDLYNAGLSYGPYIWHLIHQGADQKKIEKVSKECIHFSKKFNLSLSLGLAESAIAGWIDPMVLGKKSYSKQELTKKIQLWEEKKHVVSIGGYYTLQGISQHYLGNYPCSANFLSLAEPYLRGLSDNILNRLWYVFRYITSLRLQYPPEKEEQIILDDCLAKVKTWAALGPILQPYLSLMMLEKSFCLHDFSHTRCLCLDSIDSANQLNFTLLEGFFYERTGQLLLAHQHPKAICYLEQAVSAYQQCFASVKAKQLIEQYDLTIANSDERTETTIAQQLDVNYLLQATREITQQRDFNTLLITILQAVMQRLGARSAFLFVVQNNHLQLVAKGEKQDKILVQLADQEVINTSDLSLAIANYVYRTATMLALDNASKNSNFVADKVVQEQQLKSVLCIPLILHQQVLGVLYFENKLISAIFTEKQIEQAKLLTAQAAIALQNMIYFNEVKHNEQEIRVLNKTLEQRVEQRTEELNKANEELKNFAYVVSHDLKAPLRAINQLANWISEDYANSFDEEGQEQMRLLRNRAKRMHDMIDGILQYSRVGRLKEQEELIDIVQLIHDVIDFLAPNHSINISLSGQFPVIMGEKLRVFQVFQNIIDNAIKYNDKETGFIDISCVENIQEWQFCIADNGPGIATQYQHKVFQLFQTLKPKDQTESTGIGLSLIEKIVLNWHGRIWIESDGKHGSKFIFTLPKNSEDNK